MARHWAGGTNYIDCSAGGASGLGGGAYTLMALFKPINTGNCGIVSLLGSGSIRREIIVDSTKFFGQGDFSGFGAVTSNTWQWIVQAKAAGSSVYQWSSLDYAADPTTATHTSGSGTHTDPGAVDEIRIGDGDNHGLGDIAVVGYWDRVLSTAERQSAFTTALSDVSALSPVALHALNQASSTDPVQDLIAGADETSTVGTVSVSTDPPGYNYALTPPEVTGVLAAALGPLTPALAGTPEVSAVLAASLGVLTGAVTATVEIPASLAAALGPLAAAMSATPGINATLAAALGQLTAAMLTSQSHGSRSPIAVRTQPTVIRQQTIGGVL